MKSSAAVLFLLLAGCTVIPADDARFQLSLPTDFKGSSEPLAVKRKTYLRSKEPLTFGDYRVVEAHHGRTKATEEKSGVMPPYVPDPIHVEARSSKELRKFDFKLADANGSRWWTRCVRAGSGDSVTVRGVPVQAHGSKTLVCAVDDLRSPGGWTLTVDSYGSLQELKHSTQGELTDGTTKLQLMEIQQPFFSAYRIADGERTLGVTEIAPQPTFYFRNGLLEERRSLLGAAMSALLLNADQ